MFNQEEFHHQQMIEDYKKSQLINTQIFDSKKIKGIIRTNVYVGTNKFTYLVTNDLLNISNSLDNNIFKEGIKLDCNDINYLIANLNKLKDVLQSVDIASTLSEDTQ